MQDPAVLQLVLCLLEADGDQFALLGEKSALPSQSTDEVTNKWEGGTEPAGTKYEHTGTPFTASWLTVPVEVDKVFSPVLVKIPFGGSVALTAKPLSSAGSLMEEAPLKMLPEKYNDFVELTSSPRGMDAGGLHVRTESDGTDGRADDDDGHGHGNNYMMMGGDSSRDGSIDAFDVDGLRAPPPQGRRPSTSATSSAAAAAAEGAAAASASAASSSSARTVQFRVIVPEDPAHVVFPKIHGDRASPTPKDAAALLRQSSFSGSFTSKKVRSASERQTLRDSFSGIPAVPSSSSLPQCAPGSADSSYSNGGGGGGGSRKLSRSNSKKKRS